MNQRLSAWLTLGFVAALHCSTDAGDFPKPQNSQKADIKFTTPEEALKAISVPEGFGVTLFASEPQVQQPIGVATDDAGRLWVAENYTYAQRGTNFDDRMRDRVIILEDADRDGRAEKRTVFWDRGRRLTSVETGHGGVWVLDAPRLLFIPDRNHDDEPDSEPVVMLDGFNDSAVRHNIVNGLRWGPDGWLYGRHGILATSWIGRPGASPDQRIPINCGIWRFHPTKHTFEVVCHGTTNSWGMDWDRHGELFFINTVIGHLWHAMPGSYLRRMYGEHFNPNVYQVIEQTADHFHWDTKEVWSDIRKLGVTPTTDQAGGGHAHSGMIIPQFSNWPEHFADSVLTVNLHGRRINHDHLERDGAGYTAHHEKDFLHSNDPWFRGVELIAGRFGEMYVIDWSDIGECHENDGVHRTSGRIFRVMYDRVPFKPAGASAKSRLRDHSSLELARFLASNENAWENRMALRILAERAATDAIPDSVRSLLHQAVQSSQHEDRLRQLWALHAIGETSEALLADLLADKDEHIRVWAIRLLLEVGPLSDRVLSRFAEMATGDPSGLVLNWLASSLQKIPYGDRWKIAAGLSRRGRFANDRMLPLMIWYGIEPAVPAHAEEAISVARFTRIPLLREFIARRLTQDIERRPEPVNLLAVQMFHELKQRTANPDQDYDPIELNVLTGMRAALRGWRKAPAPAAWNRYADAVMTGGDNRLKGIVRELSLVFGDGRAMNELNQIARSNEASLDERRSAIRALVLARADGLVPVLQGMLGNRDLAASAIRGLAAYDHKDTPKLLVQRFRSFRNQTRREAVNTLVSRPNYAVALLDAIHQDSISRSEVSAFQIRQMQSYGDSKVDTRISLLWPELEQQATEKTQRIAELRELLTDNRLAAANSSHGRYLFSRSCANCHTLFGEGKKIAPDLTGAQRQNINYLLENIVDPSATVSKNFQMMIVQHADGRVLNGVIVQRTEKTITLQTATEQVIVPRDDIDAIRDSKLSMMPENLLKFLTKEQILDLVAYLQSPSQVPLQAPRSAAQR